MAGAKTSSQSAENCAFVLFPNIKNIKQWEYNDLLYLFTNNVFRCTLVNTWDLTAISLQSLEVIICVSQQVFVSWRLILRCTGRSCISDRHTDTVWNDLQVSACRVSWKAVWLHEEHAWLSGRLRFPTSPGSFCCSFQAFFGLCVVPC